MRKKIAEHMVMSRRTSAHVHSVFHVDFSTLERIRRAPTEAEVRRLVAELNAEISKANARASTGPPTDLAPLDAEDAVRRWRARLS